MQCDAALIDQRFERLEARRRLSGQCPPVAHPSCRLAGRRCLIPGKRGAFERKKKRQHYLSTSSAAGSRTSRLRLT